MVTITSDKLGSFLLENLKDSKGIEKYLSEPVTVIPSGKNSLSGTEVVLTFSVNDTGAEAKAVFDKITTKDACVIVDELVKIGPAEEFGTQFSIMTKALEDILPQVLKDAVYVSGEMNLSKAAIETDTKLSAVDWKIHIIDHFVVGFEDVYDFVKNGKSLPVQSPLLSIATVKDILAKLDTTQLNVMKPMLDWVSEVNLGPYSDNVGVIVHAAILKNEMKMEKVMLRIQDDSMNDLVSQDLMKLKEGVFALDFDSVKPFELAEHIIPANDTDPSRMSLELLKKVPLIANLHFETVTLFLGQGTPSIEAKPKISSEDEFGKVLTDLGVAELVRFTTKPKPQVGITKSFAITAIEGNGSPFFKSSATLSMDTDGTEASIGTEINVEINILEETVKLMLAGSIQVGKRTGLSLAGKVGAFSPRDPKYSWLTIVGLAFDVELNFGPISLVRLCAHGEINIFGQEAHATIVFDPMGAGMGLEAEVHTNLQTMMQSWGVNGVPFNLALDGHIRVGVPGTNMDVTGVKYDDKVIEYGVAHEMNTDLLGMKCMIKGTTSPKPEVGYSSSFQIDSNEFHSLIKDILDILEKECSKYVDSLKATERKLKYDLECTIKDINDGKDKTINDINYTFERAKKGAKEEIESARRDVEYTKKDLDNHKRDTEYTFKSAQREVDSLNDRINRLSGGNFFEEIAKGVQEAPLVIARETATCALTVAEAAYKEAIVNSVQAVAFHSSKAALDVAEGAADVTLKAAEGVAKGATIAAMEAAKLSIEIAKETASASIQIAADAVALGIDILSKLIDQFNIYNISGGFELSTKTQKLFFNIDIKICGYMCHEAFHINSGDMKRILTHIVDKIMDGIKKEVE